MRHYLLDPLREIAPPGGERIRIPIYPSLTLLPSRREIGRERRRIARAHGRRRARPVSLGEAHRALTPIMMDVEERVLEGIRYAYDSPIWGRFEAMVYTDRPLTDDDERALSRTLRGDRV